MPAGGATASRAAADAAPAGSVRLVGRVDDDVRQVLLEQAEALVYLSMFEGFGLPPLEAMAARHPGGRVHRGGHPRGHRRRRRARATRSTSAAIADGLCRRSRRRQPPRRTWSRGARAGRPLRPRPHRHLRPPRPAARPRSRRSRHDRHPPSHDRGRRRRRDPATRRPSGAGRGLADYAADWEANAQADARYAILSDPASKGGTWDDDTFLATGELEIARVFAELDRLGVVVAGRGHAASTSGAASGG